MLHCRPAHLDDIPAMMTIRNAVRENALVSLVLTVADYAQAMTTEGRAWVSEDDGEVVGFACGRPSQGDIWALFVREADEGRGAATALMDHVETWMFAQGLDTITLTTSPGTRAERLYIRRGWRHQGLQPNGEALLTLTRQTWPLLPTTAG